MNQEESLKTLSKYIEYIKSLSQEEFDEIEKRKGLDKLEWDFKEESKMKVSVDVGEIAMNQGKESICKKCKFRDYDAMWCRPEEIGGKFVCKIRGVISEIEDEDVCKNGMYKCKGCPDTMLTDAHAAIKTICNLYNTNSIRFNDSDEEYLFKIALQKISEQFQLTIKEEMTE